ncbi:AAA family ATPase [Erwinia sp. E602]|uniref:AAA family ATPase n=1 Tax=Erwinia sp. E602 TaxID=2675378 RepID=UPI001BADF655|nr:ATP-binding protein [Erwinia sp. E602]QUG75633.1 AAA family ATPase [Erwinia sp. E602]
MLKTLSVENFTLFQKTDPLQFSSGLNVIVGENGSGKTHLLKLLYSLIATSNESARQAITLLPTKLHLQKAYGEKLMGVFKPDAVGRLASRKQGLARCEIKVTFSEPKLDVGISIGTRAQTDVQIEHLPAMWDTKTALFIPTRELLTLSPGLAALYEQRHVQFEETWRDTCRHLEISALKGRRSKALASLIKPLEIAMGGTVVVERNGQFYLNVTDGGKMEMYLVAEGLRKLAMLAHLIANGTLQQQGYLFWDEPESNLNPRLIRLVAFVIHALAANGIQVFIASHSYFLMKELEILEKLAQRKPEGHENAEIAGDSPDTPEKTPSRYFALVKEGSVVNRIETAERFSELENLVMLDEELAQYDRDMEAGNA